MNVLFVNDYASGGGAELTIHSTMQLLQRRNINAQLLTIDDLPQRDRRRTAMRYISNRAACAALRTAIERMQPHVVHLNNFYHELSPAILGELQRVRAHHRFAVMMTVHDLHLACPNSGGTWIDSRRNWRAFEPARASELAYLIARKWDHRGWLHSSLRLAQRQWNYRIHRRQNVIDCALCPSRFIHRVMSGSVKRCDLLPLPISSCAQAPTRNHGQEVRFVYAGRLEPEKGLTEFVSSIPEDFAWSLTVVGSGSEETRIRQIAQKRGLADRVEFTGQRDREETMKLIAQSDVLVQPSLCLESFGRSLAEALTVSTNLLVSNRGALPEIVQDSGIGMTYAPEDPSSLQAACRTIQGLHQQRKLKAFDAREYLRCFSEDAYIERLIGKYDELRDNAR